MRRQSDLADIYGVKKIKSNPLERKVDASETGFRHSDYYHRYFRGYTEIRREKPNGKFRVERYYTRPWIVRCASWPVYWLTRVLYSSLVTLAAMLFLWAMCWRLDSNCCALVAFFGVVSAIALFLLGAVTVSYIIVPKRMTLWDHASSTKRLKITSLLTACCMALTAAAKVVYLLLYRGNPGGELRCIGVILLAAASAAVVNCAEREAVYSTVPNDTVLPEGEAHEIW